MASKPKWPWGAADALAAVYAAIIAVTIGNTKTVLTIAQLTGPATLNLTLSGEQAIGDELFIQSSSDATGRTLTFGTGLSGAAHAQTASKSYMYSFVYNGTAFVLSGTQLLN